MNYMHVKSYLICECLVFANTLENFRIQNKLDKCLKGQFCNNVTLDLLTNLSYVLLDSSSDDLAILFIILGEHCKRNNHRFNILLQVSLECVLKMPVGLFVSRIHVANFLSLLYNYSK